MMKGIDIVNVRCSLIYHLYIWNLEGTECKQAKEKCNYCGQSDYFLPTSSAIIVETHFPVANSLSFVRMTISDPN